MKYGPDTGWWLWHGERWHVLQNEDGSIRATSEKGDFTAASSKTWKLWKSEFGWLVANHSQ